MTESDREDGIPTLEGTVTHITYRNESNGYTVCELDLGDDETVIVGILPGIAEGELIRVQGRWDTHPTYGQQFKVESYERQLPVTTDAMIKYLSSGTVKGIGKKTAMKIVAMFGADTFDVIEHHPEYLTEIPGINSEKAKQIKEQFDQQFGMRNVMLFFRDYFGPATSVKIWKRFGSGAVDLVKQNPYLLCEEIHGIGFDRADKLAESIGFGRDSDERIRSGIKFALRGNAIQNGHTFIPIPKLIPLTAKLLDLSEERIEQILNEGVEGTAAVRYGSAECLYLDEYLDAEQTIVRKLTLLAHLFPRESVDDLNRLISQIEAEDGIEYASLQRKAIHQAIESGVMILTGGPGTGKTTVIRAIIRIASRLGYDVALAAPTGRAAKRMSEATSYEAKTIHRMLEVKFEGEEQTFIRNEHNLLDEELFIIDEASMIDTLLLAALLRAIKPGARLILIGDSDQLPSVGAGHVLCDLIDCDYFPVIRLTEIFRQAQESRIVTNAHAINSGELPILDDKQGDFFFLTRDEADIPNTIADLCLNRLPRTYGKSITSEIQIITPSHKGRAGTEILNRLMQKVQNPPMKGKLERKFRDVAFREGDKVMQIRNNYDIEWTRGDEIGVGIFNGDIGTILKINFSSESMIIRFDDRVAEYDFTMLEELEHAYAITVHKSQGSEYPVVILPMYSYSPRLLTRNLLYTAVTRAQRMVILVGRPEVVQQMVMNNHTVNRYTGLKYLIAKYQRENG